jgi:hypothetical protein
MEDGELGREDTFRDWRAARRRGAISEMGELGRREMRVVDLLFLRRSVREVGVGRAVRSGVEDMLRDVGQELVLDCDCGRARMCGAIICCRWKRGAYSLP